MSKVVIAGDASGTGTFTISAPNGNTDRTLVLPDEAGTVLTSVGVPTSAMPAGSVIQVVSTSSDTQTVSFTSNTWVDTTFSLDITPSSASNKIFLSFASGGLVNDTNYVGIRILRGATVVSTNWSYHSRNETWNGALNFAITGFDSPSSTSPVTYKIQIFSTQNSSKFYFNYAGAGSQMAHFTAMEIAA